MNILRAFVAALLLAGTTAMAAYPDRPVRIIVAFPPGGASDIIARLLAKELQNELGQTFVVENKAGAAGLVGTDLVAKSKPDGYTLLMSPSGPVASGLALLKNVPYDPVRDFTPVSRLATSDIVLVSSTLFPPQTFQEFVAAARAKPGAVSAELNSLGSIHHLLTELMRIRIDAKLLLVPYKGTAPAVLDLIGGHVQVGFESVVSVIDHLKANKLRALAVATEQRLASLPNVPTLKELGYPDLVALPWWALVAPGGMPKDVVDVLSAAWGKISKDPKVREQFAAQGMLADWMTPDDTAAFFKAEVNRWATVAKETGAKAE
ncbi:MAG: tripartite tricarboxylate transporter substrate binding protein [Betaproteobacteria bacterium]|nr:tripartite tricarboxylate transporter substrate binding protein [Betaproteobacteria bacterium]